MLLIIVSILILFYIVLYELNAIANGETVVNIKDSKNTFKLLHVMAFIAFIAVIIALGVSINSYYKNYHKIGIPGDVGIQGQQGDPGKDGSCNFKCGQKVCYAKMIEAMENKFKELSGDTEIKLNNIYLKNHINKICHSNSYQQIMRKERKNENGESVTPNERKLINFMKDKAEKWINEIFKHSKGKEYLESKEYTESFFNNGSDQASNKKVRIFSGENYTGNHKDLNVGDHTFSMLQSMEVSSTEDAVRSIQIDSGLTVELYKNDNFTEINKEFNMSHEQINYDYIGGIVKSIKVKTTPFTEIKKYDIWNWGNNDTITKQIVKKKCTQDQKLPESDAPRLRFIRTNNYDYHYDSKMNPTRFGPEDCPIDQLGENLTNPNEREYCITENHGVISYRKTFVSRKTQIPKEISLYHPKQYTENGIKYYPLGSVWRGRLDNKKPVTGQKLPGSQVSTNQGPIKDTILISGDVKQPLGYSKMWNSKAGCENCQNGKDATIWQPIPPKGYVCLGDVVMSGTEKPNANYVRCVPEDCVEEVSIAKPHGEKIWDTKKMGINHYNKNNKLIKKETTSPLTMYSCGSHNATEERNNRPGLKFDDDGGYNLFHTSPSFKKPSGKAYKIKGKCLFSPKAKSSYKAYEDAGFGLQGSLKGNEKYSVFLEYGKPPIGIIRKYTEDGKQTKSPNGKPKAYYLTDSKGNIDKCNSFFIKAYSKKTNKFSNSIVLKINTDNFTDSKLERTDLSFRDKPEHVWKMEMIKDTDGNPIKDRRTGEINIRLRCHYIKDGKKGYFKQYYDENGKSKEEIVFVSSDNFNINDNELIWKYKSIVGELLPNDI